MPSVEGLKIRKARRADVAAIIDIFRGDEIGHGDRQGLARSSAA